MVGTHAYIMRRYSFQFCSNVSKHNVMLVIFVQYWRHLGVHLHCGFRDFKHNVSVMSLAILSHEYSITMIVSK